MIANRKKSIQTSKKMTIRTGNTPERAKRKLLKKQDVIACLHVINCSIILITNNTKTKAHAQ